MSRWPVHKATLGETAPFLRILLPLAAAIICFVLLPKEILSIHIVLAISIGSFLLFIVAAFIKHAGYLLISARFLLINTTLFFIAWALCYYNDVRNDPSWFGHDVAQANTFVARIKEAPAEKEKTWKLRVSVLNAISGNQVSNATGDAFVYVYKDKQGLAFSKGDTILLPGRWEVITNPGNPFEFDYAGYCNRNNLFYQQFLADKDIASYAKGSDKDITLIERSHDWCMAQLARYLPDTVTKGLIQAMLLGDEVNLDEHLRAAYAETGIVHIIAISGGNVTIFFIVISCLLGWLRHKKYLWIKYAVALPLVWFYVVMAGAPPSAIRAAVMFTILAMGMAFQKNGNSLNQLFATAVVLLCAQPMWLFSIGFQLSFIAVLSLILFYAPVYSIIKPGNKAVKILWQTISASIAAEILVAPLVVYYFHLLPVLFIVANVAAFLFMGIVLVLGMLIILFSSLPVIATFIASITMWLANVFDSIVYYLQDLNPRSFRFLRLTDIELPLLYISISAIAFFVIKKKKPAMFVALTALCLLLLSFCHDEWAALKQERLVVYNINKINHIELIQGKYHIVLHTDTIITQDKKDYVLKPAYTNWACRKSLPVINNELIAMGNKTILLLDNPQQFTGSFPVDYVIVNYPLNEIDPLALKQVFSPKMLVIGNTGSRRQVAEISEKCKSYNISLRSLANNGAFILDAF